MARQIYVNLAVRDLQRSIAFFKSLGFRFNAQFTTDEAACMVVDEDIYVMLLTESSFRRFTAKEICDATKATEVLVCLSCESRAEIDNLVALALRAGGSAPRPPQDYGFMYGHGFDDPDGHVWELIYMAPSAPA